MLAAWIIFDFLNYWMHRLQHAFRPLWVLHRFHHAQTELTFLTASRIHVLEQLYVGILMMIPALLLGVPQPRLLPILVLQIFSETVQHARLQWTYGRLHGVIVSPVFHLTHHSVDVRHHNANYARIFSLWDVLFGTFIRAEEPVERFGLSSAA